jgi:FkbM family methyltransferase
MTEPLHQYFARKLSRAFAILRRSAGRILAGGPRRFYGQWSPPLDAIIWHRYFFNWTASGVCVECGAADGISGSTCYAFERHLGWKAINIEAFPSEFHALVRNRRTAINIQAAMSVDSEPKTFTQAVHPVHGNSFGNGSVSHLKVHYDDLVQQGCRFTTVEVPGITWDDVCKRYAITHVDLFVLDVEGHELAILETLTKASVLPSIFVIELWPDNEAKALAILTRLGYVDDGSYRNNRFFRLPSFEWQ